MPTEPLIGRQTPSEFYVAPVGTPAPASPGDWEDSWAKLAAAFRRLGEVVTQTTDDFGWAPYTSQHYLKDRLNDILSGEDPGPPNYRFFEQRDHVRNSL